MPDKQATDPTLDEPPGSVRNRRAERAQRARRQELRQLPKKVLSTAAIVLGVAVLLAAAVWGYQYLPKTPEQGHTHSVFRMFADGEEVSFNSPKFDMSSTRYMNSHLHVSGGPEATNAQYVIHEEGTQGVTTLGRFFKSLGLETSESSVTLDTVQGGQTIANNETHSWQLWIDACADGADNWYEEQSPFNYKHRPHDRMLITYAPHNATVAGLADERARLPTDQDLNSQIKDTCPG